MPVPDQVIGRYALFREIASGGMASVHLGRLLGPVGFSRVVAIKRLHPHLAKDPEFVTMFVEEARLAARVQHPNVVPTLDVVAGNEEIFIVMEYVEGESLSKLHRIAFETGQRIPIPITTAIVLGALHGLHAAHEARDEDGRSMQLVHRDISPQNVLVGVDGLARVVDFGIAKVAGRTARTASGVLKGKLAYMSPEQIKIEPLDRRTDIYATGVVLWELLARRRLFTGDNDWEIAAQIRNGVTTPPSEHNAEVGPALDAVVLRACAGDPDARFATAIEMADALEHASSVATTRAVGRWVESIAAEPLAHRKELLAEAESVKSDVSTLSLAPPVSRPSHSRPDGTRPGGAFVAKPTAPLVEAVSQVSQLKRIDEGPGTAATWSTAVQRRFSAPLLGVMAGVVLALTFGIVALVVRLTRSATEESPVTAVETAAEPEASTPASAPVAAAAPPSATADPELIDVEGTIVDEPPPAARPLVTATKTATAPPPPQPAPSTKPECKIVSWVDADGEKRFKRVCDKQK